MIKRNSLTAANIVKITFKAWFVNKLDLDKRIKPHHFEQLQAYMAGRGLSEKESAAAYEHGLRAYFGD